MSRMIINPYAFRAKIASISVFGSATSVAASITAPASILAGDLLVLLDRAENLASPPPTLVTPTGFTSIGNLTDGTFARQNLSYKIADGSESSSSITGMTGDEYVYKAMYVFRGNIAISTASPLSVGGEATAANPVSQTVTAGSGATPLIVLGAYSVYSDSGLSTVDPRTFSTTKDGEISPNTSLYLAYKIYNGTPANTSIDMDDEGVENFLQSCYLQCA